MAGPTSFSKPKFSYRVLRVNERGVGAALLAGAPIVVA